MAESSKKNKEENFVKIVAMGPIDLDLTLSLHPGEFQRYKIPEVKTIENITMLQEVLFEGTNPKPHILDLIRLSSSNQTIASLLLLNKAFHKKTFIEYLSFTDLNMTGEAAFIREVVKYVTEQNYLFLIEGNIFPVEWKIQFTIKLAEDKDPENTKTFFFSGRGNSDVMMNKPKKEINEEATNNQLDDQLNQQVNTGDTNEIPLNLFERLSYDFEYCNYFYFDLNHILSLGDVVVSLCEFLKMITSNFKSMYVTVNYPDILYNLSNFSIESVQSISEVISYTDIFIFDKKEALALFNLLSSLNSSSVNLPEEKKNLELLFLKEINKKRKHIPKIGIFFDDLKRVTIIEQQPQNNLVLFHSDFELKVIPEKVSKVVYDDYQKLLVVHQMELKSTFLGGFLSRLIHKKSFQTCFTAGCESLKRILELMRFNIEAPIDSNFYLIRIKRNQGISKKQREEETKKIKKEQHFVLDCVNIQSSKMKVYNPLYDQNLESFFSSSSIQFHLKKLGFINKKGQILQDPDIKRLGIIKNKNLLKIYEDEQKRLLKIKEDNYKMKLQINNLFNKAAKNLQNIDLNELENISKVYNFYPVSGKKLPSIHGAFLHSESLKNDQYQEGIKIGMARTSKENKKSNGKFLEPLSKETYKKILDSLENKVNQEKETD
jgi:hypothetical protein